MRHIRILIFAGCSVFLLAGCGEDKPAPSSAAKNVIDPAPPPPPTVSPAATDPSDAALTVSGPLIVEHQLDIAAQRDGIIASLSVDAGARVKAGALLARLDDRQLASNLEGARAKTRSVAADLKNWEAEAEVLQADYVRAQRLFDEKLIAEEQLQHAKYKAESDKWDILRTKETLNNAKEEEHNLELELEKTKVTAPFDGLIARRYVRQGQGVIKGDRLFWLTAEAPLMMRFTLPERFFGRVHRSQEFVLTSPDVPGEKHTARVKEEASVVDPGSGTFEVLVELVGNRGALRPGMTASLHVETPK
jgi:membrane fusion protein (multidrug efflux system)